MTDIATPDRPVNRRTNLRRDEQNSDSLRIIDGLNGSTYSGMCRCPAHDDRSPSLHVSASPTGKVLVKCHAGCSQERVVEALKSRRLWPQSRNQERSPVRRPEPPPTAEEQEEARRQDEKERIAFAHEIYRTAYDNTDLTLVHRYFEGRGLTTIPPAALMLTAKQSYELGLRRHFPAVVLPIGNRVNGVRAVHVIHLNREGRRKLAVPKPKKSHGVMKGGYVVVTRLDRQNPRLIVGEGVETTLSASQIIGWPAIAALGAGNLPELILPDWIREIIIAADNGEAGLNAAREATRRWARPDRVIRIAFPHEEGKDWNDVVREAEDEAELAWWREAILNIEPEPTPEPTAAASLSMREIINLEVPPREFLLHPWLASGSINMVHAQRGHAKTRFIMAVAYAVAEFQDFLSWTVRRSARVLYVDGELPLALLQPRLRLLGPPSDNLRILSRDVLLRSGGTLPDLAEPEGREFIDRVIEDSQSEFIILDSLSTLVRSGVENDAESWAPLQDWMLHHRFRGRTFIIIHHEGRSKQPRGTSKREDIMDTIIRLKELERDEVLDKSTYELTFTKTREFYGADKAPLILQLTTSEQQSQWSYQLARDDMRDQVSRLQASGLTQKDIARELELSQPRISQILRELEERRRREAREVVE
jgi:putative DNA primase/helicase